MQQSSMIFFCDECGAANEPAATSCVACQQPLIHLPEIPVAPINIAPRVAREVVAGTAVTPAHTGMPVDLWPGMILFGRYQIRQEIGRGGFSIVYLAEDLRMKRRLVAIKRIYLRALTPRQVIDATETCNREIKMLASLKTVDGVPELYESFTDAENWYLMMEYIAGQTLEEYMQKALGGYLPESKVTEIGHDLARILQELHSIGRQIIFRDVKPSNIMITPAGKLYLIDFGIARSFTPGQKKDTTPLGSPGYAPPEQYGHAQTDGRSDIYSLGMTLQTLLTGHDPLELAQGEPSFNPKDASPRLRQLLDKMLAADAAQRPPTMKAAGKRLAWLKYLSNRWRAFLSVCLGVEVGVLLSELIILLHNTHWNLTPFTIVISVAPWALMPFRLHTKRYTEYFKRKSRYLYGGLVGSVSLIVLVIGVITSFLLFVNFFVILGLAAVMIIILGLVLFISHRSR